jgi:hypothetical protein
VGTDGRHLRGLEPKILESWPPATPLPALVLVQQPAVLFQCKCLRLSASDWFPCRFGASVWWIGTEAARGGDSGRKALGRLSVQGPKTCKPGLPPLPLPFRRSSKNRQCRSSANARLHTSDLGPDGCAPHVRTCLRGPARSAHARTSCRARRYPTEHLCVSRALKTR